MTISENCSTSGLTVDGRDHAAHALVPITLGKVKSSPKTIGIPTPQDPTDLIGPFLGFHVHVLGRRLPMVCKALKNSLIEGQGFYVVMSDSLDCELRLRLPSNALQRHQKVMGELNRLLATKCIRSWSIQPYLREWDRYGGASDIQPVERFFVADSMALMPAFSSLGIVDKRRGDLYTLCILQSLLMAGLDQGKIESLCLSNFGKMDKEFELGSSGRKAMGLVWRSRRGGIMNAAVGEGCSDLRQILNNRRQHISKNLPKSVLEGSLKKHLPSLLHMTGTRLFFEGNRYQEGLAYFFLTHALRQWKHCGGFDEVRRFLMLDNT